MRVRRKRFKVQVRDSRSMEEDRVYVWLLNESLTSTDKE